MFGDIKTTAIVGVASLAVGAIGATILIPSKIETKVEIKEVEKRIVVDREIVRKIDKDGNITENIKEKDRSTEDSKDVTTDTTVTNPKKLTVKVETKTNITAPSIPGKGDVGVSVDYEVGSGIVVGGSAFGDGTVTVGIGFSL